MGAKISRQVAAFIGFASGYVLGIVLVKAMIDDMEDTLNAGNTGQ